MGGAAQTARHSSFSVQFLWNFIDDYRVFIPEMINASHSNQVRLFRDESDQLLCHLPRHQLP